MSCRQKSIAQRCDRITPETITDPLTHPLTGVTAKRYYRI